MDGSRQTFFCTGHITYLLINYQLAHRCGSQPNVWRASSIFFAFRNCRKFQGCLDTGFLFQSCQLPSEGHRCASRTPNSCDRPRKGDMLDELPHVVALGPGYRRDTDGVSAGISDFAISGSRFQMEHAYESESSRHEVANRHT